MLMTALRVFEALHTSVFARLPQAPLSAEPEAAAGWDVRNVMAAEKKRVSERHTAALIRHIPRRIPRRALHSCTRALVVAAML